MFGVRFTVRQLLGTYFGIYMGGLHIQHTLKVNDALSTQTLPGTISLAWIMYGGCYKKDGSPGPCAKVDPKSTTVPTGKGRTAQTYACMQLPDPLQAIAPEMFTICRGDFPLDRTECKQYVKDNIVPIVPGVDPDKACNARCDNNSMPVRCNGNTCTLRKSV